MKLKPCVSLMFQIFNLPNLKAVGKFKVSSRDGCRIRKAGVISFRSKSGAYTCVDCFVLFTDFCVFFYRISRSFAFL